VAQWGQTPIHENRYEHIDPEIASDQGLPHFSQVTAG
jgi:hypothetical protein